MAPATGAAFLFRAAPLPSAPPIRYSTGMSEPIYAIGDIHGQHEMLLDALTRIEADGGTAAPVVFLGDLVDRGPDSRAVIDTLLTGIDQGRDWTVLRGNHDQLFLDYLTSGQTTSPLIRSARPWFDKALGGSATLASYGVDMSLTGPELLAAARAAVPEAHRTFLASLPFHHTVGPLLFVHAGIRPGVALAAQSNDDLIWIREPFLSHSDPFDHLVVHGHTAVEMPRHYGNRINLDSGAGWGRPLTAAVITPPRAWPLPTLAASRSFLDAYGP
ncbi:serine/threonine protein phosphatase [Rhodobacteraceae bacterium D3-12]|nr:serine/threonine protein phosphatase [Rhodobacteraceae bacterium D3-12]